MCHVCSWHGVAKLPHHTRSGGAETDTRNKPTPKPLSSWRTMCMNWNHPAGWHHCHLHRAAPYTCQGSEEVCPCPSQWFQRRVQAAVPCNSSVPPCPWLPVCQLTQSCAAEKKIPMCPGDGCAGREWMAIPQTPRCCASTLWQGGDRHGQTSVPALIQGGRGPPKSEACCLFLLTALQRTGHDRG